MQSLGLDSKILIAQIVNFGILFFVLKEVLYKPIIRLLDERNKKINEALANSAKIEEKLKKIESQEAQILSSARSRAKLEREELLKKAQDEKQKLIEEAKYKAEKEIEKGVSRLKVEADQAATEISDKLIGEVVEKVYKRLISTSQKNKFPLLRKVLEK